MLRVLLPLLGWVLIADCRVLFGPPAQRGYTGSSLLVICHYDKDYQRYTKFWCKKWQYLSTCKRNFLIYSDSDKKVEKGRVSIEDKRRYSFFEVTMNNLQLNDSGIYQCGIDAPIDIRYEVTVNVSTAHTSKPEEKPVTTEPPEPAITNETDETSPKLGSSKTSITLIYCVVGMLSLLLLATVLLVVMSRRKRTGLCLQRKKETKPSDTVTVYSTAGAPRKNLVPDHPASANGMGLYSNAEISPESNGERVHSQRKIAEKRNEVAYATLMISELQQEAIYANVDSTPSPGLPQAQDVFYTEVKKRPRC